MGRGFQVGGGKQGSPAGSRLDVDGNGGTPGSGGMTRGVNTERKQIKYVKRKARKNPKGGREKKRPSEETINVGKGENIRKRT